MPDATGTITITFTTDDEAELAFAAVSPDDDEFARTKRDGKQVTVTLRGQNAKSLLRAADDFLACASVAEDVMNAPPMDRQNA